MQEFLTEIKLEVGCIPGTRNEASLQGLKPVRPVSQDFRHPKGASPLGGQLVLQLVWVSLPHYQVNNLELSGL